jgi:hypothetical protein
MAMPFVGLESAFAGRVVARVLAAVGWAGIIGDQMPCFLGAPNCD